MSHSPESEIPAPTPSIRQPTAEDTVRILLATDNHLGYNERDPIRGQDSINTFREILQLAVKHDVDFLLLAGDLFHENRPSRDCLYQTIALLREYTLGDKPVEIELLSDPNEGKAAGYSFPAINYEDTNLNVGIPTFSIHGNHDDPQGAGPEGALSALDILSACGLINYMGKFDLPVTDPNASADSAGITIRPVMLRKGNTRLGLYGVGNVKDQRMHFELRSNRVKMYMPYDKHSWFNIMLVHQNRVKHGPQEYVPEGLFDDNVDLVIWGHEHDCRIVPEAVAGKRYYITQPGSSVATSLADGESIEKHVALLQVQGKEFQLDPIPLRTVRPFVLEEVVLLEAAEDEGFDAKDQMEVSKFLKSRVNALIEKANIQWDERNARAVEIGEQPLPPMLPLIRLKVDTTGVSELSNPVRFGHEFAGRLANPRDVLTFHRAKKVTRRTAGSKTEEPELSIDDPTLSVSERLSKVRVQTLVREYLSAQELQLLGEGGMGDAIETFVEKDDPHAIQSHVTATLKSMLKGVQTNGEVDEDDLDNALDKAREIQEREYADNTQKKKATKGKGKARAGSDAESVDSMMVDDLGSDLDKDDDSESEVPKKTTKKTSASAKKTAPKTTAAKKAPTRGKGKKVTSDDDDDEDDIEMEEEPAPKKKTSRAAVLSSQTTKAPARKKTIANSSKPSTQSTITFAPTRSSRTAATKSRSKTKQVVEIDSD